MCLQQAFNYCMTSVITLKQWLGDKIYQLSIANHLGYNLGNFHYMFTVLVK